MRPKENRELNNPVCNVCTLALVLIVLSVVAFLVSLFRSF